MRKLFSVPPKVLNIFLFILALGTLSVRAAVPTISYSTPNVYTINTAIFPLTPVSSGVGTFGYGSATTLSGGTLSGPYGIGVDASGNIYVPNTTSNTILQYSSAGTYLGVFITSNTILHPTRIVFDASGNAYITSQSNGTVVKYNSSGTYQSTIVTGIANAYGLAIDASGNLYVADRASGASTGSVIKYSSTGTVLLTLSTTYIFHPQNVAVDPQGNIYVINGSGQLLEYNSSGTYIGNFVTYNSPFGLSINSGGTIFAGDVGSVNKMFIYNYNLSQIASFSTATGAYGMVCGTSGVLFSASASANAVYKYTPTGGYFIDKPLPAGLVFDCTTGAITGTPTVVTPTTTYTITCWNASGSASATCSITVGPTNPSSITGGGTVCAGSTVTLTASGGSPSGGTYSWWTTSTGGTLLGTGNTYSPTVNSTTTYYASYTVSGATSATPYTSATVTVNPNPIISTAPISGTAAAGLNLAYPFSGNANDVSGNGNNGIPQNSPTPTTDRYGAANSAYSFNGSTQYIATTTAISNSSTNTWGPQNFSISVWFKTTTTSGGLLVGFRAPQTGVGTETKWDRHIYMTNSGQLYYGAYVVTTASRWTINTTSTYNDGNWHHVVATTSTTGGSFLYVDGVLQASNTGMTTSENFLGVNGYWRIAAGRLDTWLSAPTSNYFAGSLDDIAIYTSALTQSQVYSAYGAGIPTVCAGSPLTLQVNTVAGATYSWTGPNSYTSTSQNPTVSNTATTAMAGAYTCTVTSASGCTSTITYLATVNAAPSAAFTATSSVVVNGNATITYTGTDPVTSTYAWNFNGGTPSTGTGQGPFTVSWSSTGTKTITLTVTNANGCQTTSTQNVLVGPYGNYAFNDIITLNTTSLGITSNLTNFPALLSIQDNNLIISTTCNNKVQNPNGPNYDFAFYDPATSSELYYQIESYNQTTGTLLVWVQIPTLTYASNKTITFWYGSNSPPTTHNTTFFQNTWASDYQVVYHFNEASYTGSVTDATANSFTGTCNNMTSANFVTGKVGNAYSFNGTNTSISAGNVNATSSFTLSAWVNLSQTGVDQKIMTNQTAAKSGYKLGVYSNNLLEAETNHALDRGSTPAPSSFSIGAWHYVQGVYTGSSLSVYVDGAGPYQTLSTSSNSVAGTPFYVGVGEGGNTLYFKGLIDEVRVSNVVKTSDWIKAEYTNQSNPTSFTSVGATTTNVSNASALSGALTYTWTGATSTDPSVATNWNNTTASISNQAPSLALGTATLVIPTGLTNYPTLTGNSSIYGLTIANGATLNLNGYTLSVGCNVYNSSGGQLLYGSNHSSGLIWNGSLATQTYAGSSTSNTASLGSMTVNNSAGGTVIISGGPVDIYKTLTITKGNLSIGSSPAGLTLKSTATQSASVAAIPSGSSITGTVNVERYITGGAIKYRGYRLLSSPVYSATVSSNNVFSINYLQNSIYLTGNAGGGFDKTGNPTLYLFREDLVPSNTTFISGNFWGISAMNNSPTYNYYMNGGSTTYNIPVGNGYLMFFRGNRSATTVAAETVTSYVPTTVTLTASGTLNQGQIVVHNWYTPASAYLGYTGSGTANTTNYAVRGFNLVGNPYASSIDWEQFNTSSTTTGIYGNNVGNTIYEWNDATNNYDTYQQGGINTNNGTRTIASGQGFFVLTSSASNPQLIFNESAKTVTQNTGATLFMSTQPEIAGSNVGNIRPHIRMQLAMDSINKDDTYIGFFSNASSKYVFNEDAEYRQGNGRINLASISSDNVPLAIDKMPPLTKQTTIIPLYVRAANDGVYKLNRTELEAIPQLYDIWLIDAYKKDSVNMRADTSYSFDIIHTDTNTYGSKRFRLVIRQNIAYNYHLLSFNAAKVASVKQVQLNWITQNEQNYTNFTVERSTDSGKSFQIIGGMESAAAGNYNMLDKNPSDGLNLYRLKQEDINNMITYSNIVPIQYTGLNSTLEDGKIGVYPNPAKSTINISLNIDVNTNGSLYNIQITNSLGLVLKQISTNQFTWQTDVSNLMPGTYMVKAYNAKDGSLIGSAKFVKL